MPVDSPRIQFVRRRTQPTSLPRRGATLGGIVADGPLEVVFSERAGEPGAATVVFLHNGGANRRIWDAVIARIDPSLRVLALDFPGYGESDAPISGFRRSDYARVLEQFLDEQVADQAPVLVGNCMGSAFAWTVSIANPDRVGALVLINPLTEATARRGPWGWLLPIPKRFDLGRIAGWIRLPWLTTVVTLVPQLGLTGLRRGLWWNPELTKQWRDAGRMRPIASLFHDIGGYGELDRFERPDQWPWTAMVWGTANWGLSPRAGAGLAAGLKSDVDLKLRGAGHLAMLEEPERIAEVVRQAVRMRTNSVPRGGRTAARRTSRRVG